MTSNLTSSSSAAAMPVQSVTVTDTAGADNFAATPTAEGAMDAFNAAFWTNMTSGGTRTVEIYGQGAPYGLTQPATTTTRVTFAGHIWDSDSEDDQLMQFLGWGHAWHFEGGHQLVRVIGHSDASNLDSLAYDREFTGFGQARTVGDPVGPVLEFTATMTPYRTMPEARRAPRTISRSLPRPARAYDAFEELARWLQMTHAELATTIGVGRTTPYVWRKGREPRPSTGRRLYELHAVVRALRHRLGHTQLQAWLARGDPSPRTLLADGNIEAVDTLADEIIFQPPAGTLQVESGGVGRPRSATAAPRRKSAPRAAVVRSARLEQ